MGDLNGATDSVINFRYQSSDHVLRSTLCVVLYVEQLRITL
jgi:hypothetical protein